MARLQTTFSPPERMMLLTWHFSSRWRLKARSLRLSSSGCPYPQRPWSRRKPMCELLLLLPSIPWCLESYSGSKVISDREPYSYPIGPPAILPSLASWRLWAAASSPSSSCLSAWSSSCPSASSCRDSLAISGASSICSFSLKLWPWSPWIAASALSLRWRLVFFSYSLI